VIGKDPKSIIDHCVMSVGHWLAVLITVGLNAMDGFDVLSITFALPGLPSINAAAAELSSQRCRSLAVSPMLIGYPIGGVIAAR